MQVCVELGSMISAGSPPDLVLDFTLIGEASEVMKKISLNLGLPTVTTALGEEAELWSWADLSPEQQGYLVQVRSPADIFPNVLTDLANVTEINTAVVLYDDTFSKLEQTGPLQGRDSDALLCHKDLHFLPFAVSLGHKSTRNRFFLCI